MNSTALTTNVGCLDTSATQKITRVGARDHYYLRELIAVGIGMNEPAEIFNQTKQIMA